MEACAFARYLMALFAGAVLAACGTTGGLVQSPGSSAGILPQSVRIMPQFGHANVTPGTTKIRVLYDFKGITDGAQPNGSLLADSSGNLYGVTHFGGSAKRFCSASGGCGTVYELGRSGKRYSEKVVYAFSGPPDGAWPLYENLISDKSGALYGTTYAGGTRKGSKGLGTVFKVTPSGAESILYSFTKSDGGGGPMDGVIADAAGNLYGTTVGDTSPNDGYGAVYELKRSGSSYTERVLHLFQNNGSDGILPSGALVMDGRGALYGTTGQGGSYGYGTVFKLSPSGNSYNERILYSFGSSASDGENPGGVLLAAHGMLYGTTEWGGATGDGTIFKLSGSSESIVYNFHGPDGDAPTGPLLLKDGHLYGTTVFGGSNSDGAVYKVSLNGSEVVLYSFTCGVDQGFPTGGLLPGKNGHLFGVASGDCRGSKSSSSNGAVFELH